MSRYPFNISTCKNDFGPGPKSFTKVVGTSCKKIHIRKKIRKEIRKKIQEDTFNDPVSTPYGKANSSLRPDSFLKSLVIPRCMELRWFHLKVVT